MIALALLRSWLSWETLLAGSAEPWLEACDTTVLFPLKKLPNLRKDGHPLKEAAFPLCENMMAVVGAELDGYLCVGRSREESTAYDRCRLPLCTISDNVRKGERRLSLCLIVHASNVLSF